MSHHLHGFYSTGGGGRLDVCHHVSLFCTDNLVGGLLACWDFRMRRDTIYALICRCFTNFSC